MGLVKLASFFAPENQAASRSALRTGTFDVKGGMAQHHFDKYHFHRGEAGKLHAQLQGMNETQRAAQGNAVLEKMNFHRGEMKRYHGLVTGHTGSIAGAHEGVNALTNPRAARFASREKAIKGAASAAAEAGPSAAGNVGGMLGKVKDFALKNKTGLAVGGALAAGGLLAAKAMSNKKQQGQYGY